MVYFITVNYNSVDLIGTLLDSIAQQSGEYQLVVVNNSVEDAEVGSLKQDRVVVLESGENLGFGGGCNIGLEWVYQQDTTAIAWLINPDVVLTEGALEGAIAVCKTHSDYSIMGTLVKEPTGEIWFSGGKFDPKTGEIVATTSVPTSMSDCVETDWVTGCSMVVNLHNFSSCPRFDPAYFLYYEDFDFCRRYLQQGHRVGVTHSVLVIHQPSSITSRNPAFKLQHSTFSYLLALERHTHQRVLLYRLGRILGHAARVSGVEPTKAIAIIKGVLMYGVRRFGRSHRS